MYEPYITEFFIIDLDKRFTDSFFFRFSLFGILHESMWVSVEAKKKTKMVGATQHRC